MKICGSIEEVVAASDAILHTSLDGRVHFEQFQRIAAAGQGKPVFVDKPFALRTIDARAIFNVAPKLTTADLLVFDDAHAGEQYVSKAYTVSVPRGVHDSIYGDVLEAIAPMLSKERHHQLIQNSPGAGTHGGVIARKGAGRARCAQPAKP